MVVLPDGAYCGIAPVPGGRVNIGIVLAGGRWRRPARPTGAAATTAARARTRSRRSPETPRRGARARATDAIAGRQPARQPRRAPRRARAGSSSATRPGSSTRSPARGSTGRSSRRGWPRTRSTRTCAATVAATRPRRLRPGDARPVREQGPGLAARPGVPRPAAAVRVRGRRRLAERDDVRATMGLVMGDLVPASRALDPRFLAGLLGP